MRLDAYTLLIVTAFISALVGILLALTWSRNRNAKALLWWATSFLMAAFGTLLLLLHGHIHKSISIDIGHTLGVLSCGLALSGVRVFNGRSPNLPVSIVGAVLWVFLIVAVGERFTFAERILMTGLVTGLYFGLCGWELWRGSGEANFSQGTAAIFLLVHAGLVLLRVPIPVIDPGHTYADALAMPGFTLMTFEALVYSVGLAFLLLAMTLERGEQRLRKLALTDPLTGVANRRAVENAANRLIGRDRQAGRPTAMLAFDLDHFKRVNDTFGHDVGDRVLCVFSEAAQSELRPSDIFGRMGGEEFTAILPDTRLEEAIDVADRIRRAFAEAGRVVDGHEMGATASTGVAVTEDGTATLAGLKRQADLALYRAKADGRNAVRAFAAVPISANPSLLHVLVEQP